MVIEVLTTNARIAVGIRIITPTEYSGVWEVSGKEVLEPIDPITCRPRFLAMSIQAMDADDTSVGSGLKITPMADMEDKHTQPLGLFPPRRPADRERQLVLQMLQHLWKPVLEAPVSSGSR